MNKEDLRKTIMTEEEMIASRRRFGLFSQPPPIALGDDGAYKQKRHSKGPDGKPITQPRQLLAGPLKSGVTKSSYFSQMDSIHQKDPYINTYKREMAYFNKMHKRSQIHETQFKPGTGPKSLDYAAYEYIEQKQKRRDIPERAQNGKPITKDRNFVTNLTSKIDNDVMKFPKHIPDPYERKEQLEKQAKQIWRKKLPQQVYKSMSHSHGTFSKIAEVYGEDDKAKSIMKPKNGKSMTLMKTVDHQKKFKLARKGHGDPIGRYPQFIGKLSTETIDIPRVNKLKTDQPRWKPNNFGLSRPTPSISLNSRNLGKR